MTQLVDYSSARPAPSAIVAAGFTGVIRYLSTYTPKNLSAGERDALHAAGLAIALVWETDGVTTGGASVGASHARAANAQADALGYPADCVIFYATDHDYTAAAVAGYYQGVASAGGRPWGVYGGIRVLDGVTAPYYWQTQAWSGSAISPRAHIYQHTGAIRVPGTGTDDVLRPLPMWVGGLGGFGRGIGGGSTLTISGTGTPTPAPAPATPARTRRRTAMFYHCNNGLYYLVTDFNIQIIEPAYVATATVQWGAPVEILAADITRLQDIVNANRTQAMPAAAAPAAAASVDVAAIVKAVNDDAATRRSAWH